MKKIFTISLLALSLNAYAYGLDISVGPTYQNIGIAGKVFTDHGKEINLTKDIGLDRADSPGFSIQIDHKKHHFSFDYAYADFTGEKTLEKDISFHHRTFTLATHINSYLKYDLFKVQYYYDLIKIEKGDSGLIISPLAAVNVYNFTMNIKAPGNISETISGFTPAPNIGLNAQLNFNKYISMVYQISGMAYSNDSFLEGKAFLRLKPVKFVFLDVGYDYSKINFHGSSNLYNLHTQGLYVRGDFVFSF